MEVMRIISLGWGVQSFTLAVMAALGDSEPVDYAIHADTTHERSATYEFAKKWTGWLENHSVKVVTVINKSTNLGQNESKVVDIPAFTKGNGVHGKIRRQCTGHWKIRYIKREMQKLRNGKQIEQWLGISLDEVHRMKNSDVKYITNRWPLVEKKMTRHDCKIYLEQNGIEMPPRSACVFCPFQTKREWRELRDHAPGDWWKAIQVDKKIRMVRPPNKLYVNAQCKPLDECNFEDEIDKGQLNMWEEECNGVCGL
jgi:3'-phosphoadenosine 5'-phosphosulfate sulfotransferase (PAPS reductase)/FAD synthetase